MNDAFWLLIFGLMLNLNSTNIERNIEMEDTMRKLFENTIRTKLENPEVTAEEINILAHAYAELTKNDHLAEMAKTIGNCSFGLAPSIPEVASTK